MMRQIRCLGMAALGVVAALTTIPPPEATRGLMAYSLTQDQAPASPTYYRDVRPILQNHCVACHAAGGIAPMSFETYENVRRYALIIRTVTQEKTMPPAFAVPLAGRVTNNPALTGQELATLAAWADAKAPEGSPDNKRLKDELSPPWSIPKPDLIVSMAHAVDIPADGPPGYIYEIVPTHFRKNLGSKWPS